MYKGLEGIRVLTGVAQSALLSPLVDGGFALFSLSLSYPG